MDLETFVDAQLWLRRVDEGELIWPDRDEQTRPSIVQLLPPTARTPNVARTASQSQPTSQPQPADVGPLTCSGSFHSASRICYFRPTDTNEDQTLLRVELIAVEQEDASAPARLLVRLDHDSVYEVAVPAIQSVTVPERPRTTISNYLPPFGSLDFGSVTLRLWLEPHDTPVAEARGYIVEALQKVEKLRSQHRAYDLSKKGMEYTWQDSFRHNRWMGRREDKSASVMWKEPAELLRRGEEILSSDADKEALKMVITNLTTKGDLSAGRSLTDIQEDAETMYSHPVHDQERLRDPPTEQQRFDLVVSLVHVFGEDHAGLRQLLGSCAVEECTHHESCSRLSSDGSSCVMQKWQRWDEFLHHSSLPVSQPNKRQRTSSNPQHQTEANDNDSIQAAGSAFVGAIISPEEHVHLEDLHRAAKERLRSLEDAAFGALFAIETKASSKSGASVRNPPPAAEPLTPVAPQRSQAAAPQPTTPHAPHNLTHSKAEHTWNFLLESRRALIRQELTLACLPRRDHQTVSK